MINFVLLASVGFVRQTQAFAPILPAGTPMHILDDLSGAYAYSLEHYRYPTQSLVGGFFAVSGNALSQRFGQGKQEINLAQSLHFLVKGIGGGILWSIWYDVSDSVADHIVEKVFSMEEFSRNVSLWSNGGCVLTNILLEQFAVAPLLYTFWDIPVPTILKGGVRPNQLVDQVCTKLPPMLLANAQVWTPANLVTYSLPPEYRLIFSCMADLVWQTIQSKILVPTIPPPPLPSYNDRESEALPTYSSRNSAYASDAP